jgi:hypothetical protein
MEFHLLVPLPTYLGITTINDSQDLPTPSCRDLSIDTNKKDLSWSHGLDIETSPIKNRSAQRKAQSYDTVSIVPPVALTDLEALRHIKAISGVGGALKKASLQRLIDTMHPSIIFLQ